MNISFIVAGLSSEASGVAQVMSDLSYSMTLRGHSVRMYNPDCRRGLRQMPARGDVMSLSPHGRWCGRLCWSPELKRMLRSDIPRSDVVHSHMPWGFPQIYSAQIANRNKKPFLLSPHGSLEPWAVSHSAWKKRLFRRLLFDRELRKITCFHVFTQPEAENIRRSGFAHPVAIIPNGVGLEQFDRLPPRDAIVKQYPELRDKRRLLFLSRLHKKKGVEHLLDAWRQTAREFPDWHLILAGPDDGMRSMVLSAIGGSWLAKHVTVTGKLTGTPKLQALAAADAFVLPSFSEGFSIAILEAMSCRLPVMITKQCNFDQAFGAGAAIEVEPNAVSTEQGLREVMSMSDRERQAMGQCGRDLVESKFTWERVSEQILSLYRMMLEGRLSASMEFIEPN